MIQVDQTLAQLAAMVGGEVVGDKTVLIKGLSGVKEAREGDLSFLANEKYVSLAKASKASALVVGRNHGLTKKNLIVVDNPSYAFGLIIKKILKTEELLPVGVHPTAVVDAGAKLGKNVGVGPHVVIEAGAAIGDGTKILAGCYVGRGTTIGKNGLIYPNVCLREGAQIGNNVVIHCGAVIGADGFGFEAVEGVHEKIPQVGIVVIEDDVEIGANTTIDRARFDRTVIGRGTKIDNLVQIGHNVIIGKNCIIVAGVGIAGSVRIEDGVILAGQAGVAGHLTIGEGAIATAQAGVISSVPPRTTVSGFPAFEHEAFKRSHVSFKRLPAVLKNLQALAKRVEELEKKSKG